MDNLKANIDYLRDKRREYFFIWFASFSAGMTIFFKSLIGDYPLFSLILAVFCLMFSLMVYARQSVLDDELSSLIEELKNDNI